MVVSVEYRSRVQLISRQLVPRGRYETLMAESIIREIFNWISRFTWFIKPSVTPWLIIGLLQKSTNRHHWEPRPLFLPSFSSFSVFGLNCSSPRLPLFHCLRGLQHSACFSIASWSLRRVWPIHCNLFRFLFTKNTFKIFVIYIIKKSLYD